MSCVLWQAWGVSVSCASVCVCVNIHQAGMCTAWGCGPWGCLQLQYKCITALHYMINVVCEVCGMVLRDLSVSYCAMHESECTLCLSFTISNTLAV